MNSNTDDSLIYETLLPGGTMWSMVIGRHRVLRLTDVEGGANVGALFYNALERQERYNMPDTLKGQHIFHVHHPFCLHSDMGRVLASVTADTRGWHDTVCGCSSAALVQKKWGVRSYQEARNDWFRNGHDCFLIELAKWGLGERDLTANVNFFSRVVTDVDGGLHFVASGGAGDFVELRFEMDTLVVLNSCQHPLDPAAEYAPSPVGLAVYQGSEASADDACRNSCPENVRAFTSTAIYHKLRF
ncbi:MAG: urea amidolyase associated protein UAAP1 [Opitutales bacterium]